MNDRCLLLGMAGLLLLGLPLSGRAQTGAVDSVAGGVLEGWAYAGHRGYNPVDVRVRIDGDQVALVTADRLRKDLPDDLLGRHHGFALPLPPLAAGSHVVEVAVRDAQGTWVPVGTAGFQVSWSRAGGAVEALEVGPEALVLRGWAFDADAGADPVSVQVLLNGEVVATAAADLDDPALVPHLGSSGHRFQVALDRPGPGLHELEVQALDAGSGDPQVLPAHVSLELDLRDHLAPLGAHKEGTSEALWLPADGTFRFRFDDGVDPCEYVVDPSEPDVQRGTISVTELHSGVRPIVGAGTARLGHDGRILWPEDSIFSSELAVSMAPPDFDGRTLVLGYTEEFEGVVLNKTVSYTLDGRTLVVDVEQEGGPGPAAGRYMACYLGRTGSMPDPRTLYLPYMARPVLVGGGVFVSQYADVTRSHANQVREAWPIHHATSIRHHKYTRYMPDSRGEVQPLSERIYVTLSHRVEDVFPTSSVSPGPYRDAAARCMVYDTWGVDRSPLARSHWEVPFAEQALHFEELKQVWGLDHVLVLRHNWGSYMDFAMPRYFPANDMAGGDPGFLALSHLVREQGWLFAAHENPTDMMPPNPVAQDPPWYDPALAAREADLSPRYKGALVYQGGLIRALAVAPDKQPDLAAQHAAYLAGHYWPNAGFWDVQPYTEPLVDLDASNPDSRTFEQTVRHIKDTALVYRQAYQGPLSGESHATTGSWSLVYAGYVDGLERELLGGEDGLVMPDFELRAVQPLQANQGMGYWGRFFSEATRSRDDFPAERHHDLVRARTVAYGHTGFVSDSLLTEDPRDLGTGLGLEAGHRIMGLDQIVKEYYLLQALQVRMLEGPVASVRYVVDGRARELSGLLLDLAAASTTQEDFEALVQDTFRHPRLAVDYANGLQVRVNCDPYADWTVTLQGATYTLPPDGWVARRTSGGDDFTAYLAYVPGFAWTGDTWAEVSAPEYWFHDDRQSDVVTIIKPGRAPMLLPY